MNPPRKKFLKYLHIAWAGFVYFPVVVYFHFVYMIRYAKHPEKYPLEKRYKKVRKLVRGLFKLMRVKVFVTNLDEYLNSIDKVVMIINHQAVFDPLILIYASPRPMCFVAKKEVKKYPWAGKILMAIDGVFLDREHLMSQIGTIKEIVNKAKDPNVGDMGIYIEGTRNKHIEGNVQEYKAGTIKVAYMTNKPIVSLNAYGTWRILSPRYHLKHYACFIRFSHFYKSEEYKAINNFEMASTLEKLANKEIDEIREEDINYYTNSKETKRAKKDAILISKKTPIILKNE